MRRNDYGCLLGQDGLIAHPGVRFPESVLGEGKVSWAAGVRVEWMTTKEVADKMKMPAYEAVLILKRALIGEFRLIDGGRERVWRKDDVNELLMKIL